MTIKEAEKQTGLARSNIRFYEKEKLLVPARDDKNGYRNYSEKDIETIKKIAYLRTLDISIEDIRDLMSGKESLISVIKKQTAVIQTKMEGLDKAKRMCESMLKDGDICFEDLDTEKYAGNLQSYWGENKTVLKRDTVSFLHIWGSFMTWIILTSLCLIAAVVTYANLPAQIPVQWNHGAAVSFADNFSFARFPHYFLTVFSTSTTSSRLPLHTAHRHYSFTASSSHCPPALHPFRLPDQAPQGCCYIPLMLRIRSEECTLPVQRRNP